MTSDEKYLEHEVKIRMQSFKTTDIYAKLGTIDLRFDRLESKIDNNFKWTIGIMITMFGGLILTKLV